MIYAIVALSIADIVLLYCCGKLIAAVARAEKPIQDATYWRTRYETADMQFMEMKAHNDALWTANNALYEKLVKLSVQKAEQLTRKDRN